MHGLTSGSSGPGNHDTRSMAGDVLPLVIPVLVAISEPNLDPLVNSKIRPRGVSETMERWPEGFITDATVTPVRLHWEAWRKSEKNNASEPHSMHAHTCIQKYIEHT
jgi:hypothetical protein